ncbi:hypothetical protein [Anaeromicropila herbilytica]|uniref:HTH tetR-type domain-containing protein n=1 Tax=Anaeromicropila herbilytica TaxID=2785025 RepID=A0A7R7ENP2_9FIRM|nr:hypothetical protein [Anaeromicropila herbilytica]BCN31910.1 hypothetical protein bsdtb5_32050 [Anaeromicropila herbilytica]
MKNPYLEITEIKVGKITEAQTALYDGLILLWKTKPAYKISVRELIQVSHVARSTFYVYYQNIDELTEEVENYHILQLLHLNQHLMNPEIKAEGYLQYYQDTINYVEKHKSLFYAFLVSNLNNRFVQKWKSAIKYHLLEREYRFHNKNNYQLVLEMAASEVIAAYTFWLSNPYEVDLNSLDKVVTQTLKLIEF